MFEINTWLGKSCMDVSPNEKNHGFVAPEKSPFKQLDFNLNTNLLMAFTGPSKQKTTLHKKNNRKFGKQS